MDSIIFFFFISLINLSAEDPADITNHFALEGSLPAGGEAFLRALKKSPFAQFLCQTQILILEIPHVFLWLKLSSSLTLNKIEYFLKLSALYG